MNGITYPGEQLQQRNYGKGGRLTSIKTTGSPGFSISGMITPAIFLFLGYLFLANAVLFSKQTMIIVIIIAGIWFLLKR